MEGIMKNISKAEVLVLKDLVTYQDGQVVSKTLVQNKAVSVTLFSFAKGEEISTHQSDGDAFVICLDGVGAITIDDEVYELQEGQSIVSRPNIPMPYTAKKTLKCCWLSYFKLGMNDNSF